MSEVAMRRWCDAMALFVPSLSSCPPLSLIWCRSSVSHCWTYLFDERDRIGTYGGSNGTWYVSMTYGCTYHRTVQTKPDIEHTSVRLAHTNPIRLCSPVKELVSVQRCMGTSVWIFWISWHKLFDQKLSGYWTLSWALIPPGPNTVLPGTWRSGAAAAQPLPAGSHAGQAAGSQKVRGGAAVAGAHSLQYTSNINNDLPITHLPKWQFCFSLVTPPPPSLPLLQGTLLQSSHDLILARRI